MVPLSDARIQIAFHLLELFGNELMNNGSKEEKKLSVSD
jgi:hypothetical protein